MHKILLWVLKRNISKGVVVLSTQNKCYNRWNRTFSQFYAQLFCLNGPMISILYTSLNACFG